MVQIRYCKTKTEAEKLARQLRGHKVEVTPAGNYKGAGYIVRWSSGEGA